MSVFRHPAFPEITHTVPDNRDQEARDAGWLPTEVAPQTPPPAVRKQTPIGPGQVPKGNQA